MKLFIREENRELLRKISEKMSGSPLTVALNFVLETQGPAALEQLEAMRYQGSPNTSTQRAIAPSQSFTPERQVYVPELDSDAVESAFD